MLCRLPWGIALSLGILIAGAASTAAAGGYSNRLAQLAARQDLYDEVCYAMADGSINPSERASMLQFANKILPPQEYQSFVKALDRLSPPKPISSKAQTAKRSKSAKSAQAAALAKKAKQNQNQKSPATASVKPQPAGEPAGGPVIPTGAILPDRMTPLGVLR